MFQNYLWVTGTTDTARKHCRQLTNEILDRCSVDSPVALEIGSNDGTLFHELSKAGASWVFGVDPASNLKPKASPGVSFIEGFFSKSFGEDLAASGIAADVIVARNVLSHVPDLNDVMLGIRAVASPDAVVVIEFHEASGILRELHYESIYHEHTFYHSIKSIQAALSQIDFTIFDLTKSPISGGSFVVYASRLKREQSRELSEALSHEEQSGIYREEDWIKFAGKALENLEQLREIFRSERDYRWVAFGASARSSTLLNSVGEPASVMSCLVDNNPLKQGKKSPGLGLPIVSPGAGINSDVQKVFVCAFNFEEEIIEHLRTVCGWSGEVILPLPTTIRRYFI
jgi:SAM-dependent methyltransferase